MSVIGSAALGIGSAIFGKRGRERRQRRRARRRERRSLQQDRLMDQGEGLQGLAALGGERSAQAWGQQQAAHDRFAAMAEGRGPSLAQQQAAASTQQAITDQQGLAASARGGNLAAQTRQAGAIGAAGQMAGSQQAAMLRSQEQLSAMQGQAGLAAGMGQQAQQMELAGHGMGLQHLQGQQQANLAHRGQNMQLGGQIAGGVASLAAAGAQASDERVKKNVKDGSADASKTIERIDPAALNAIAAGGRSMLEADTSAYRPAMRPPPSWQEAASMSDERAKQNTAPGGLAAAQAVGELEPKSFEYKPGFGEPGQRVGIMAQALEKTPAGQSIVMDTPHGKMVDNGGLAALATAATADQEQRLKKLEGQLGLAGAKR
jgi:hypothetical protein